MSSSGLCRRQTELFYITQGELPRRAALQELFKVVSSPSSCSFAGHGRAAPSEEGTQLLNASSDVELSSIEAVGVKAQLVVFLHSDAFGYFFKHKEVMQMYSVVRRAQTGERAVSRSSLGR